MSNVDAQAEQIAQSTSGHKIPITIPIWRLDNLLETSNELLIAQIERLRASRAVRRLKPGKKPAKERPQIERLGKGCFDVSNINKDRTVGESVVRHANSE